MIHHCSGHMRRFMEVCLLELLFEADSHGYALAEQLADLGFSEDELHIGTLYRTLRGMEQSGFLRSFWKSGGAGPRRRVYSITQEGLEALDEWMNILQKRQARIKKLLSRHTQAKNKIKELH